MLTIYGEDTLITKVLTRSNLLKGHFYIASTEIHGVLAWLLLLCFHFKNLVWPKLTLYLPESIIKFEEVYGEY